MYSFVERHYADYKKVPSRAATKQCFPNFSFVEYPERIEFFIDQLKEGYRRGVLEEYLLKVNPIYTQSTKKAEDLLREALKDLAVTQRSFKDLNLIETAEERLKEYEERKKHGVSGILTKWTKIDYQTLGFHPEEFIVIVGEKYIGKSWLMLWMAYQAMLQGERVLVTTKEMSSEDLADRFDSICSSVSYDSLRRAELSNIEEQRYRDSLLKLTNERSGGSITLARHSTQTINDIEHKVVEVDATIVFIDSVYLFDAGSDTLLSGTGSEVQRRMAISQRCKHIAQTLGVPVVVTTQAGRRKTQKPQPGLDNIEWSNAFSQDADVVMEVIRDDIDKELNQAWLYLLKCRKGQETNTCVSMDFNFMKFTEKHISKDPQYEIEMDKETMFNE